MTDRAYGYFELNLFDGAIKLPLKFCTSYPGEDRLRATAPTKTGIDGRPTNRVYVLKKENLKSIEKPDDIEKVIPWNGWTVYLNTGTATNPCLEPLSKYDGLQELLEQDKLRSKDREITVDKFYSLESLRPYQYTGRHFHTYPHTSKIKDSENYHNIYRLLVMYMKKHNVFLKITYFSKGEELGVLYEDNGVLRIAGLHADSDLKPVQTMVEFPITRGVQKIVYEKFDTLQAESNEELELVLEWRDYVQKSLGAKLPKKAPMKRKKRKVEKDSVGDLKALFSAV